MKRQTTQQREIAEGAAQPYLWADAQMQSMTRLIVEFVAGNSDSTVATDVKVIDRRSRSS
jgi:hypothetical protein